MSIGKGDIYRSVNRKKYKKNFDNINWRPDLIIVGSGPSIKRGIKKNLWKKIKYKEIWSINDNFKKMPYLPEKEVWVDKKFFDNNKTQLLNMESNGVKLIARNCYRIIQGNEIIPNKVESQYKTYKNRITLYDTYKDINKEKTNKYFRGRLGSSGIFALSIATKRNYGNIFLLGYDWAGNIYNEENVKDFKIYNTDNIYNVSTKSNIPYFQRIDYEVFFDVLN